MCALICPDVAIEVSRDADLVIEPENELPPVLTREKR